jgi:hypothetical protein
LAFLAGIKKSSAHQEERASPVKSDRKWQKFFGWGERQNMPPAGNGRNYRVIMVDLDVESAWVPLGPPREPKQAEQSRPKGDGPGMDRLAGQETAEVVGQGFGACIAPAGLFGQAFQTN